MEKSVTSQKQPAGGECRFAVKQSASDLHCSGKQQYCKECRRQPQRPFRYSNHTGQKRDHSAGKKIRVTPGKAYAIPGKNIHPHGDFTHTLGESPFRVAQRISAQQQQQYRRSGSVYQQFCPPQRSRFRGKIYRFVVFIHFALKYPSPFLSFPTMRPFLPESSA